MLTSQWVRVLLALLFSTFAVHGVLAVERQSNPTAKRPGWLTWIDRPWDTRYLIIVDESDGWASSQQRAIEKNAKPGQDYFSWKPFFSPLKQLTIKPHPVMGHQSLAIVAIDFDQTGLVTSPHTHSGPLRGRLNELLRLGLSEGDAIHDRFFRVSHWFTGLGDASTHWAPAFCDMDQLPDPLSMRSERYLYGKNFKSDDFAPLFGCREWAYQLYDNDRPYIDVTSYEPTSKGRPPKAYIRTFIGWARFGDHKPVIGQQLSEWYCLHDCPGGDIPGPIPDIKAWAKRSGWLPPVPPTRVPTFPDPPAKSGTYSYGPEVLTAPASTGKPSKQPKEPDIKSDADGNYLPDVPADLGC